MSEIDSNKVMIGVVTDLTKETVKSITNYLPSKIKEKYFLHFHNFEDYLNRTEKNCAFVRTIINKETPVGIDKIYVKGRFKCGREIIGDDELCQRIRDSQRVVVSGFGGIGKTIFCKYLWNSIHKNPIGKIPVYCELRNLNDLTTQNLETYIRVSLTYEAKAVPEDLFREMMIAGRFVFILDGFDEVPERLRLEMQAQILKMASFYGDCCFLVSSRADDRFSSWLEFHTYTAMDFDKAQSREIIQKIDFDKEIKKEFSQEILEKRYDDYRNLFSTPLLTLMMLMTYMQIRYIPDSRHVFYRYAFQTLYTLHDASKQGFQRKRYVEMGESDFINAFSLFCLVTYADLEHSFTKDEVISYVDKIKLRARSDFNSEDFLKECVESVNLLYKDGDQYTFIHRTFQEYFCAYAATHYFPDKVQDVVAQLPVRHSDSVFSMMYSINPDVLTKMYILPFYRTHQSQMNQIMREKDIGSILKHFGAKIVFFVDYKRKGSRFGYGISFSSDVYHFTNSVVCMFKTELPFHRRSEHIKHVDLIKVSDKLRPILVKLSGDHRPELYRAMIDFESGEIELAFVNPGEGTSVFARRSLSDLEKEVEISSFFEDISQAIKAELVFSKRKCDDLARKARDISKRGDGILAL